MAFMDKITETRALPQDINAEMCLLGAILLDNSKLSHIIDKVKSEHFYSNANRIILDTMISLYDRNIPLDLTTLRSELERNNLLEKAGGVGYIASLEENVLSPANIEHYAQIVFDKAKMRELISAAYSILESAYNEEMPASQLLEHSEKIVFDLTQSSVIGDFLHVSKTMPNTLDEIQRRYSDKHDVSGLRTSFLKLDELTSGFQPSDLIILAARPSKGKTAFALNIALNVARDNNGVGIFSLEMSSTQINQRFISLMSNVPLYRLRSGRLNQQDLRKVSECGPRLANFPIFVDDTPGMTMLEMRAKARRLKARMDNLSLIIIDYLQLMHYGGKAESRQQEVSQISRSCKALARELNIPVIAVSQLSRLIELRKSKDKRPMLSDLRESGAIEQDADIVIFIHPQERDEEEAQVSADEDTPTPPAIIETDIIIGKQRNGPLGTVKLLFTGETTYFANPPLKWQEEKWNGM